MLVPEQIVERWYHRDHFIYKNFAFLFQNKLWDSNVPNGFSVCPYFWMSMFSFCFFRPFIYPALRIANFFSVGPLKKYDNWFGSKLGAKPGAGIILLFLGSILLFLIGSGLHAFLTSAYAFVPEFWYAVAASGVGMFTFVAVGAAEEKHPNCNARVYVWLWGLVALGLGIFLFPSSFVSVMSGLWWFVLGIFELLWFLVYWVFRGIWLGIVWLASWGVEYRVGLYWFAGFFTLANVINYVVLRNFDKWFPYKKVDRPINTFSSRRNMLLRYYRIYSKYKRCLLNRIFSDTEFSRGHSIDNYIFEEVLFSFVMSKLQEMSSKEFDYSVKDMERHVEYLDQGYIIEKILGRINTDTEEGLKEYDMYTGLLTSDFNFPENEAKFDKVAKKVLEHCYQQKLEAVQRSKKMDALCQKFTKSLGWIFVPFQKIWKVVKVIWTNLVTFFAYMKILIKAKKQKACPYIMFKD